jgi:hypothetical protein
MAAQACTRKVTADTKARISEVQRVKLNWNSCSSTLLNTITAHTEAVGAPKEYIFFPLLTVSASFMGVNARMSINEEWSEPAILWNVVVARKGEKKTVAMKHLLVAVEVINIFYFRLELSIT